MEARGWIGEDWREKSMKARGKSVGNRGGGDEGWGGRAVGIRGDHEGENENP